MTYDQSRTVLKPSYAVFPTLINVSTWIRNHKTRQTLAQLSEGQLKDIGLTVEQAQLEITKPFWK